MYKTLKLMLNFTSVFVLEVQSPDIFSFNVAYL